MHIYLMLGWKSILNFETTLSTLLEKGLITLLEMAVWEFVICMWQN